MPLTILNKKLNRWNQQDKTRTRCVISSRDESRIMINNVSCVNFSSNDYLGLIQEPSITDAFVKGAKYYGFGSGSSSLVSGYFEAQQQLEEEFAQWLGIDKALYFSSGYLANIGAIPALADRKTTIISDKYCHASLLDGIQLSRAHHFRYPHQDIVALNYLCTINKPQFIITESIFSMEGDITPISQILNISNQHKSSLIIDDAHGIGVLGQYGRGIMEHSSLTQNDFACIVAPLGKAFNAMGAIVAGKENIINCILQFARSYRYTTALPPAVAYALLCALNLVKNDHWRREKLNEQIEFFIQQASLRNLSLASQDKTPIQSVIIGENKRVLALQKTLQKKKIFVSCIRPPTVPENKARIRVSLNCLHTKDDILYLLNTLQTELSS